MRGGAIIRPAHMPGIVAGYLRGMPYPLRVVWLGNSLTYGAGGPYGLPGARAVFDQLCGEVRGDVQLIGTLRDGAAGIAYEPFSRYSQIRRWSHEGHSGFRIPQLIGTTNPYGAISNVADNGSGLIQVTLAGTPNIPTGAYVQISGVGGVTAANGYWRVRNVDASNITLDKSTFAGAYTTGGTVSTGWPVFTHYYDSLGQIPNVVMIEGGLNDFSGGASASTTATNMGTLIDTVRASYPDVIIMLWNLGYSTANDVKRLAYNALLPAVVASRQNTYLVDISDIGYGETISGGEYSAPANAKIGRRIFEEFERLFPLRRGPIVPRRFVQRVAQTGASLGTGDYLRLGDNASPPVSPVAGNWMAAITLQPSALTAISTLRLILQAGDNFNGTGFALMADGPHLTLYGQDGGAPIVSQIPNVLSTSRVSRIVVGADATDGSYSIWANSNMIASVWSNSAWTAHPGQYSYVGAGGGWNGVYGSVPGVYRDVVFCFNSAAVPGFHDMQAVVDADYWGGELLPGATYWAPLSESSSPFGDLVQAGTGTSTTGSTQGAASMGATFATPWDFV